MNDTSGGEATPARPRLHRKKLQHLKALCHHLKPVVQGGKAGLTDGVYEQIDAQLLAHELIKIRFSEDFPMEPAEAGDSIADQCSAVVVQKIGRTLAVYKRHPDKPKIDFPR